MSLERLTEIEEAYLWSYCGLEHLWPLEYYLAIDDARESCLDSDQRELALMLERHGCLDSSL